MKLIDEWEPASETRVLKYGSMLLAGLAAAGGMMITGHYRTALRLRHHGLITGHLPVMVMPAVSVGLTHALFITRDVMLFKTWCPVCVNVRAVAIQLGFAVALPVAMATVSSFHLAERKMTYPLPTLSEDPRLWASTWRQLTRPLVRPLAILVALNALAAAVVTHWEASEFYTLLDRHRERERARRGSKMEEEGSGESDARTVARRGS